MQPNACAVQKIKGDMTASGTDKAEGGDGREPPRPQKRPRSDPFDALYPAMQVGSLCGISGTFVGAVSGVVRSSTPVLFALASGVQWFTLGTTFAASRGIIRQRWDGDKITPGDSISISAISGGIAGSAGGLLRGPKNIIPAAIMFAALGAGGQALYNRADDQVSEFAESAPKNRMESFLNSKWSPMRPLSTTEYEAMVRERLLRVNADIAIIDENIAALRAREREMGSTGVESQAPDAKSK